MSQKIERIASSEGVLRTLMHDVESCPQDRVLIQAGHFPVGYGHDEAWAAFERWGEFTNYSFVAAEMVAESALAAGKTVEAVIIADDCVLRKEVAYYDREIDILRRGFYTSASSQNAHLNWMPGLGLRINELRGHIVRHDLSPMGLGWGDCNNSIYEAESHLQKAKYPIEDACARAYVALVRNHLKDGYLVSFIPWACHRRVCDISLDQHLTDISASHIFLPTRPELRTFDELLQKGAGYRKD